MDENLSHAIDIWGNNTRKISELNASLSSYYSNITSITWTPIREHELEYNLLVKLIIYIGNNPIKVTIAFCIILFILYYICSYKEKSDIIVDEKSLNKQRNWEMRKNEKT